ncbi:MAG: chromosome segregation protein SMC [Chitinophagales bacterium]|nr:chromosome segregation protein SMC [Chitinophagales bacterium]
MRLTSLEIKGFKSFADKTVIHFNENITGVVGPNGSGKSNVVDAMRWVIGEQRTSNLRSEKMSNLIFNGSRNRKPAGMAEVSLSFENTKNLIPTDFANVTVTRILYRNGDSEYKINDVACRLKDITNLFLDTGISSDSYAIIELKMIDEILHDRENSRRRLFEQAAGISKYKQRKKETLAKLQAADADLARVEDLLFEIGNNLKSLEAQAKKTKRFYQLKETYKEASIELAKHHWAVHQETFKKLETQRAEEHNKKLEAEVRLRQLESELEKQKLDILEQEKHLSSRQKELNEVLQAINKKESEQSFARQQQTFLTEKIASLEKQVAESGQQQGELEQKLLVTAEKKANQEVQVAQIKQELEALNQQLNDNRTANSSLKTQLDTVIAQKNDLEKQLTQLDKDIAISISQKEGLQRSIEQNKNENKDREESLQVLLTEITQLQQQRQEQQEQLDKLLADEENLKINLENTQRLLEETRQQLARENRSLDQKQNEYNLNKSLVDNLEGFPESIKFLKKNKKDTATAPLLSDVIYCKGEYRTACENYLEPYLNYLVADTAEEAQTNINLLNEAGKGRISFFVLDDLKDYESSQAVVFSNAVPLTEAIEVDPKYHKLAAFLLDKVYIVNDADLQSEEALKQLGQDKNNPLTFLSQSGKYARTWFSFGGGSVGLFEGMRIGRSKNLEKLKKEIEELQEQKKQTERSINQLEQQINKLKGATKVQDIQHLRSAIGQLDSRLSGLNAKVDNYRTFIDQFQAKNADIEARIAVFDTQISANQEQAKALQATKAEIDAQHFEILKQFNEASQSLSEASSKYNEKNILFHQQQNLLNSLQQEADFTESRLTESKRLTAQHENEIVAGKSKLEENFHLLATLENLLSELRDQRDSFQQGLTEVETGYFKAKGDINTTEERIRNWQKQQNQNMVLLESIKDKQTELRIQLQGLKERLSVEFHIDLDKIAQEPLKAEQSKEELQQEVERIRNRVETFGEINPMAVEAFDEMQQRHDFITTQKADLVKAKDSLTATMDEIEASAREQFMAAFSQVRDNFQKVFRSLFTPDDTCDLLLTEPENPLESDIEIIAKPKGKKPQVIDQLSGGEKTLTALAILFSLYLLKPAPFCILDEVDAPLDDANIGKFNQAIRQFSTDSQFIMVTHNKQTMAAVDVIYGVTMYEPGVSKVVPVDFRSLAD